MVTQSLQWQLDLEANCQVIEWQTKKNLENGKDYVGSTKTPYQSLMLDRWILTTKERHVRHRSFLPQEVVRCEVWTSGLQIKHNYK